MGSIQRIMVSILVTGIFISCGLPNTNIQHEINSLRFTVDTLAVGLENPWGMEFFPDGSVLIA